MNIAPEILARHVGLAAAEQLADEYRAKGYATELGAMLGGFQTDLVARRGGELIVVEIRSSPWSRDRVQRVKELRQHVVSELGGRFLLALAPLPDSTRIDIPEMEAILESLAPEHLEESISQFVARPFHYEVTDVEVEEARIAEGKIEVRGTGLLGVTEEDGAELSTHLPFAFHLFLDPDLTPASVRQLRLLDLD